MFLKNVNEYMLWIGPCLPFPFYWENIRFSVHRRSGTNWTHFNRNATLKIQFDSFIAWLSSLHCQSMCRIYYICNARNTNIYSLIWQLHNNEQYWNTLHYNARWNNMFTATPFTFTLMYLARCGCCVCYDMPHSNYECVTQNIKFDLSIFVVLGSMNMMRCHGWFVCHDDVSSNSCHYINGNALPILSFCK